MPKRRQSAQLIVDSIPLDSSRFSQSNASMMVPHFDGSRKLRGTHAAPDAPGAAPAMSEVVVIVVGSGGKALLLTPVLLMSATAVGISPVLRRMSASALGRSISSGRI